MSNENAVPTMQDLFSEAPPHILEHLGCEQIRIPVRVPARKGAKGAKHENSEDENALK